MLNTQLLQQSAKKSAPERPTTPSTDSTPNSTDNFTNASPNNYRHRETCLFIAKRTLATVPEIIQKAAICSFYFKDAPNGLTIAACLLAAFSLPNQLVLSFCGFHEYKRHEIALTPFRQIEHQKNPEFKATRGSGALYGGLVFMGVLSSGLLEALIVGSLIMDLTQSFGCPTPSAAVGGALLVLVCNLLDDIQTASAGVYTYIARKQNKEWRKNQICVTLPSCAQAFIFKVGALLANKRRIFSLPQTLRIIILTLMIPAYFIRHHELNPISDPITLMGSLLCLCLSLDRNYCLNKNKALFTSATLNSVHGCLIELRPIPLCLRKGTNISNASTTLKAVLLAAHFSSIILSAAVFYFTRMNDNPTTNGLWTNIFVNYFVLSGITFSFLSICSYSKMLSKKIQKGISFTSSSFPSTVLSSSAVSIFLESKTSLEKEYVFPGAFILLTACISYNRYISDGILGSDPIYNRQLPALPSCKLNRKHNNLLLAQPAAADPLDPERPSLQ